jgi:hypothetical protein
MKPVRSSSQERGRWRWRRAKLGIVLLWSAGFSKLSRAKKILLSILIGLAAFFVLLPFVACPWTREDSIAFDLRGARNHWLRDECPRPLDPEMYLPTSRSFTSFVYTASLTAKDPDLERRTKGLFTERTSPGLFAIKLYSTDTTYVIATTGEIYSLDSDGIAHLFRTYE